MKYKKELFFNLLLKENAWDIHILGDFVGNTNLALPSQNVAIN